MIRFAAVIGSTMMRRQTRGSCHSTRNLLHHYVHQTGHEDASTFWCGCGAIRRAVFLETGGFNGGFGDPSIEDIEFGYRLRRAGRRIRLAKDVQVTHLKRWTARSLLRTDIFARAVPWTRLIIRSRMLPNDLNVKSSARASVALIFVLAGALAAAPWLAWGFGAAILAGLGLVALNAGFYRFCGASAGRLHAGRGAVALAYFACAGIGFIIGTGQECWGDPPWRSRST